MKNKLLTITNIFWPILLLAVFAGAQTLTVDNGVNDHADSFESPNGEVVMLQLEMAASGGDVEVTGITVNPLVSGVKRGDIVDLEVRIYQDKNNNGYLDASVDEFIAAANYGGQSNQTPTSVTVTIPNHQIPTGTTQNWLIVNAFTSAVDGDDIAVQVTNIGITSGSVVGTPVSGNIRTFESNAATQTGSLFVGPGGKNPIARNVSNAATNEVMLQIVLSASTLEGGTVTQVDFAMSGTGDESTDLTSARLYYDGDANGKLNLANDTQIGATVSSFTNDGTLSFSGLSRTITAGSVQQWIVVYNFNGAASNGETFALSITPTADITVSAAALAVSGGTVNGNAATISATGSLTLSAGTYNPTARTISASEQELEMMQLNLAANATENIDISQIVFKTTGTANEGTDIDSAVIILDNNNNGRYDVIYDTRISVTTSFTDNGNITFGSLSETINAGASENWLLLYYLNGSGSADETFKVYFDDVTQVTATGASSAQSISPLGLPVNGFTMTISSTGTLTIAVAASNTGDANFSGTATNLAMLAFTMEANDVEDIDITGITVTPTSNGIINNNLDAVRLYEDVDENGLLNLAVDRFITSQAYSGAGGQPPGNAVISISDETIAANSSVQWLLVNTISSTQVGDNIELRILSSNISGTGAVSSSPVNVSGPNLLGGTKTHATGIPGSLTLGAGPLNPASRFISAGASNVIMMQFRLTADAVENIDITEIKVATSGSGNESNDLTSARLYVDGDNNGSFNALYDTQLGSTILSFTDDDTLTFTGFSNIVSAGTSTNYIVVYNFNAANNAVGDNFSVLTGGAIIVATGVTSTSGITPAGSAVGNTVTITDTGTLTVSAGPGNPGNTNVTNADNNVVTIQLNVAAGSNEDVTITAFTFRLSGTFDDGTDFETNSFRLFVDDNGNGALDGGEAQLDGGQTVSADNGFVTFTGFTENILADTDRNYILLANLNGNASDFENFRVSFVNSTDLTATGDDTGNDIFADGVPVQGGLFTVDATGSLSLTRGANNPSAGTESASATSVEMLQLRLAASAVENISISSISFTADGTGQDLNDIAASGVSLYLDVNNDGALDGGDLQIGASGNFSGDNGTITFGSLSEVINAGTSENWLVVYNLDGSASNGETFRVGIYNAAQITATGVTSTDAIVPTGLPVAGNFKTISTVGSLSVFAGDFNPGAANIDSPTDYVMFQIKLTTSSIEGVTVNNFIINHQGTGDVTYIASGGVQLVRDNNNNGVFDSGTDDIIATANYSGSTATLSPGVTIAVNSTENWLVMYDFSFLVVGETYQVRFVDLTNLDLTGATSAQPIIASGSVPISGGTMSVDNDFGLPVELTSFIATGEHGYINLEWVTESELNNMGFTVERIGPAEEYFQKIASYDSHLSLIGAGNTSTQTKYVYNDSAVVAGVEYTYRLIQHDYSGIVHVQQILATATAKEALPTKFELAQNYPNPFNPETLIKVGLPQQGRVVITIFNILGQEVVKLANTELEAGHHNFKWDGTNSNGVQTSSGLYFYTLQVKTANGKEITKSRKMIKLQ